MKKDDAPLRNTVLENEIEEIVRHKINDVAVIIDIRPTYDDRYRVNVKKSVENNNCVIDEYRIIESFYFIGTKLISD